MQNCLPFRVLLGAVSPPSPHCHSLTIEGLWQLRRRRHDVILYMLGFSKRNKPRYLKGELGRARSWVSVLGWVKMQEKRLRALEARAGQKGRAN
jgi:hypothetical protein